MATLDARLCAAEESERRPACEAVVAGDARRCAGPACRRLVERWSGVLEGGRNDAERLATRAILELEPRPGDGAAAAHRPPLDLSFDVARGVVVAETISGYAVELGRSRDPGSSTVSPGTGTGTRLAANVVVAKVAGKGARLEHLELEIPGSPRFACTAPGCGFTITMGGFAPERGAVVRLEIAGPVDLAPHRDEARLRVTTFVRDVVAARRP
jgi:hypothetical protein